MKSLVTLTLVLATLLDQSLEKSILQSNTFSQGPDTPMKPPFAGNHAGEVFIGILTELGGNVWLGFVSSLYGDDLEVQRGECFGQKTFGHMKELTRVTSASDPKQFYRIMAGIVMQMYSLGKEVKESCKFERIYNDILEFCTQYDSCQPRRVLMRTLGNF